MLKSLMKLLFGNKQDRDVRRLQPIVDEINVIHADLVSISDEALANKTQEFRKLLGVGPRSSRVGDELVMHERAEEFLNSHPDLTRTAFVATRRDMHPSRLVAFVVPKEAATTSADLAGQIASGMSRLGAGHQPERVFLLDKLPMVEDDRGREVINYKLLWLAAEQVAFEGHRAASWSEIEGELKIDDEEYDLMKDVLPEAFAVVKEVCRRHKGKKWSAAGAEITWEAVPYDVQLMGGITLAEGNISEMATGEGKTLTAVLPLYLRALTCRGSHLATVNDYLARRDSEWNAPLFAFLGMTVGCLDKTESHSQERRAQYQFDITYGTVSEYGFDYLRDNMCRHKTQLVQRRHYFCIIDEVDSVLIDEARTPLIISGPVDRSTAAYDRILPSIRELVQKQNLVVSQLAREAKELLDSDDEDKLYDAGYKLLQCYKGSPKHRQYMKMRQEPSNARLQERVEMELRRKKILNSIEEDLFFVVDESNRTIELTEKGRMGLSPESPESFTIPDIVDEFARIEQSEELDEAGREAAKAAARKRHDEKAEELHTINQLLHSYVLKVKDIDYVVEDGKVVIVDENTGRKMPGRRWSDGLHQAVEAKEAVKVEAETQTLATITIQNYFRMYVALSGMTGTAETEAAEFHGTYGMDVIVIPTNRPIARDDMDDTVYRTKREKIQAVLAEIERLNKLGLPILVGTTSVYDSEVLSKALKTAKLKHNVLNAKNHQTEAAIISSAGQPGAITIATNMAGRGTDIKLGEGVSDSRKDPESGEEVEGGLQVIGTERHEARRIDRQLRGRSGRQGDPGCTRFYVCLEDDLMRKFGSDRIAVWLQRLGMEEGEPIIHPWVTKSITKAQKKVEMINHDYRKRTLQFDDVLNKQRGVVYTLRHDLLVDEDLRPVMLGIFEDAIAAEFKMEYGDPQVMGDANITGWIHWVEQTIATQPLTDLADKSWPEYNALHDTVMERVAAAYDEKVAGLNEVADPFCRYIGLSTIDGDWQDHLLAIDDLRHSVGLRSYAQRDPLVEFTKDASALFDEFMLKVNKNVFQVYFRAQPMTEEERRQRERVRRMVEQKAQALTASQDQQAPQDHDGHHEGEHKGKPKTGLTPYRREIPKVGRNEPCPCGSGKKYKDCHGDPRLHEPVSHTVGGGATPEQ